MPLNAMADRLEQIIIQDIRDNGAMRLDRFMGLALGHPEYGYYITHDPFGVDGDFITAPEISQIFGEIIGIWCAQQWLRLGSPARCHLIEIGPGRGTLMADLLRGTRHITGFHAALTVHLVETSPALKKRQSQALQGYDIAWHDHIDAIETDNQPVIIVANEFLDALPVRQFQMDNDTWQEHFITVNKDKDSLETTWLPTDYTPALIVENGAIVEISDAQTQYAAQMKTLLSHGGAALIIDYGFASDANGDSLQALYRHKPCHFLSHIGQADITTHVNFPVIADIFAPYETHILTQGTFMHNHGGALRLLSLVEKNPHNAKSLQDGYLRIIAADQMGDLFKTLMVFNSNL